MTIVKSVYLICNLILDMFFISIVIASPVFITPGYYWWSGFGFLLFCMQSHSYTKRLNSWFNFVQTEHAPPRATATE